MYQAFDSDLMDNLFYYVSPQTHSHTNKFDAFEGLNEFDWLAEWNGFEDEDVDYARGGTAPTEPNDGVSRDTIQATINAQVDRQLRQWGLTDIRAHQPQVVPNTRPNPKNQGPLTTTSNQPDHQANDLRTGEHVNVEVEVLNPQRRRESRAAAIRQFERVVQNDPTARSVLLIHQPQLDGNNRPIREGRLVEKRVYDPTTRRTTQSTEPLREEDVHTPRHSPSQQQRAKRSPQSLPQQQRPAGGQRPPQGLPQQQRPTGGQRSPQSRPQQGRPARGQRSPQSHPQQRRPTRGQRSFDAFATFF
ncbi:hypothetical protein H6F86_19175 [Phormidium sp. FACHB-592]|uniref:Uncharacterized protein n=1 Tax=Stenomitos frigidus AS-A4 TaxID=2933935 RepID=A0ABV0KDN3_9CYAN|nr:MULTISPECIES: hypothetical protein [Cyanophyceae]MBD2034844.1 hypothetical protein [Leptolyngbya sp. FACHB-321]MBD2075950.1 hypothetical protein [Phormidium sp. FACHB-592]